MEQTNATLGPQTPLLIIPKQCTALETNYKISDNVLIDVKITSQDTEGHETCIYNGLCNVKLIENYDVDIQVDNNWPSISNNEGLNDSEHYPSDFNPNLLSNPDIYNQNQVWIDPCRSPYVYNHCDIESYDYSVDSIQSHTNHITVEQHNTYITQNVYNYKESMPSSPTSPVPETEETRQPLGSHMSETQRSSELNISNLYEDDEFACGVFLSQLQDEILNEKKTKARKEQKYIGLNSDDEALKQLMSSDIQSMSKQRKTILFLGHDSHCGQTIQKIAVNDPSLVCSIWANNGHRAPSRRNPNQKRYQCDKCKQIFEQITTFKQHMIGSHKGVKVHNSQTISDVKFMCTECGKSLKTQKKFESHCMGHGNPELECSDCHKVFASKFTLRTHRRIHERKFNCVYCTRSFLSQVEAKDHTQKTHSVYLCDICGYKASVDSDFSKHKCLDDTILLKPKAASETDDAESFLDDGISESELTNASPTDMEEGKQELEEVTEPVPCHSADEVIAKVMSNKMFLLNSKKARRYNKICNVCYKKFDRMGDLKRHLIEHIIQSTLSKTPVSKNGTLDIQCKVCQKETFKRIDKYKAHLREHAKLTIYKCNFCDKSFSDSSNFSKHKKIHSTTYYQCDLCQRKFNSKKMIAQHMDYHKNNSPLPCTYCGKIFHFESKLNKHIKLAHTKEFITKFRCRFCPDFFKSLKEKWDHEWIVHNVRNYVVDCLVCGLKFRKYTELKRHCTDVHAMEIPRAKDIIQHE